MSIDFSQFGGRFGDPAHSKLLNFHHPESAKYPTDSFDECRGRKATGQDGTPMS
jgi:hypothetical protein